MNTDLNKALEVILAADSSSPLRFYLMLGKLTIYIGKAKWYLLSCSCLAIILDFHPSQATKET